jgi:hypothetical protein
MLSITFSILGKVSCHEALDGVARMVAHLSHLLDAVYVKASEVSIHEFNLESVTE